MIVVGGGVVGLSVAFALRRAGHDVVVHEAETVGSGASSGNAGWLTAGFGLPDLCRASFAELDAMRAAGVEVDVHHDGSPDVESHLDPATFCAALHDWLTAHDVEVREHSPVRELPAGETVVVAAGVGSRELVDVELDAVKGYSIDVPLPDDPPTRAEYVHDRGIAISPFPDRLRIAGFLEPGAHDATPSPDRARELVRVAGEHLGRELHDPGGAGWAGLRPTTPDGRPRIERLGERTLVATGHGMLGVTLAPVTGRLVADLLGAGR